MSLGMKIEITIMIALIVYLAVSIVLQRINDEDWSSINLFASIILIGLYAVFYALAMVWGWY